MNIHRLIREGRLRLGLSEQQFADAVGVSRGAVQQWEKPGGTAPKRSNQALVAKVLGVSLAQVATGGVRNDRDFEVRAEVPLLSQVEAGNYTVIDNFKPKGQGQYETVAVSVPVMRHTYALRVHGDSMHSDASHSFPEGSILIVEPDLEAVAGDFVIAADASGKTTFKQLTSDGTEFFLKPLNARYPIRPLGTAKIIGVVREVTRRLR